MMQLTIVDMEKTQKNKVEATCRKIIKIYEDNVAEIPPLGVKPIYIHQGPGPRTHVDPRDRKYNLCSEYHIDLNCLVPFKSENNESMNKVVYQFGHELGHVYLFPSTVEHAYNIYYKNINSNSGTNPHNWLIESCCCALSFVCLNKIRLNHGTDFKKYRIAQINDAKKKLKDKLFLSKLIFHDWIQSRPGADLLTNFDPEFWPPRLVCAVEIEKILMNNPKTWGALCFLGDATDENGNTNYELWKNHVTLEQKPLVGAFEDLFKPLAPR